MKYAIRIGLAALFSGLVTFSLFQVARGLLKMGAGMSFKAGVSSIVRDPHVVYLEPKQGENYEVLVEKGTLVFLKSKTEMNVEFSSPAIADYLYGTKKNLYGNPNDEGAGYPLFRTEWASDKLKSPDVVYLEIPGRLVFHDYQRSTNADSVEVGIYGENEGSWQWVTDTEWLGRVMQMEEHMRLNRAWPWQNYGGTPADFEPTGITIHAGDYLFLNGVASRYSGFRGLDGFHIRVGLRTSGGQVFYWPMGREAQASDDGRIRGGQEIKTGAVMPRGFLVPVDGELMIACLVGVNFSYEEMVIGTRSARVNIKVLRRR